MHKLYSRTQIRVTTLLVVVMALTTGCQSASNWLRGRTTADAEPVSMGTPDINNYLTEIYKLASGDPATQAEIFADTRSAATLTPGPSTELRFALVLATPGHVEMDNEQAQSRLRGLLSQTELMTPGEIALATIHLKEVEERLVLAADANRLRSENTQASTTEDAAVAQRITNVEAENRRLRRALADAEAKLEALSAIERSIREQPESETPRR